MRVLILRRADIATQLSSRFEYAPEDFQVDLFRLDPWEQSHLKEVLKRWHLDSYDRIVVDLKWARIRRQPRVIQRIPNLVIHEQDTWFNFYPLSRAYGQFERFYYRIPRFRLICTGYQHAEAFRAQGLDVRFVPKSYCPRSLRNLNRPRAIEYGFIGSRKTSIYHDRNRMLRAFQRAIGLDIATTSKQAYLDRLNDIRVFVSADMGMREYMAKNFEAMACGCLLLAYRQGREEERLGLKDMENVLLYSTLEEALEKLRRLGSEPGLLDSIASAGQALAEQRFTTRRRDEKLFAALRGPFEERPRQKPRSRLRCWVDIGRFLLGRS